MGFAMIGPDVPNLHFAASGQSSHSNLRQDSATIAGVDLTTPVLVIEDEAMIAWMVESLLEDMGFTSITLAANGEEALETARGAAPGLIITDINLGAGMDGIAAASAIRAQSAAAVILITGYGLDDASSRCAAAIPGAPILTKPVQILELQDAIARVLAGSASRDQEQA